LSASGGVSVWTVDWGPGRVAPPWWG
jgi:hypothetical protein